MNLTNEFVLQTLKFNRGKNNDVIEGLREIGNQTNLYFKDTQGDCIHLKNSDGIKTVS